jgi:hypothetical protein
METYRISSAAGRSPRQWMRSVCRVVAILAVGVAVASITIVAASAHDHGRANHARVSEHGLGRAAPVTRASTVRRVRSSERTSSVGPSPATTIADVRAITKICSGARLFEGSHRLSTRADALAVARDIRASTRRRLDRVRAVPVPRRRERLVKRWIALERRLADVYAESWVGMFDAIDAAQTPGQRERLPALLSRLLHAPDRLRVAASQIELVLQVPDCTGGAIAAPAPHAIGA